MHAINFHQKPITSSCKGEKKEWPFMNQQCLAHVSSKSVFVSIAQKDGAAATLNAGARQFRDAMVGILAGI